MNETLKIGKTVILKSGGPVMTVVDLGQSGDIWCCWKTENNFVFDHFSPDCLESNHVAIGIIRSSWSN